MKAHETVKWGVNVAGPDSILPAKDFEEACQKSAEINNGILAAISEGFYSTECHPIMFARVFIWDENECTHDPENTDWNELC